MKEIIGERLRRERHRRGIKQTFLAEQIGVQSATIEGTEVNIMAITRHCYTGETPA